MIYRKKEFHLKFQFHLCCTVLNSPDMHTFAYLRIPISSQCSLSIPPENIRKLYIFWCLGGIEWEHWSEIGSLHSVYAGLFFPNEGVGQYIKIVKTFLVNASYRFPTSFIITDTTVFHSRLTFFVLLCCCSYGLTTNSFII